MRYFGEIIIREVPLPRGVHGALREDPEGNANIYVNQHDPIEERRKTVAHELRHYRLGHIGSGKPVHQIEKEAEP
ncbi:MAG: ImmA/IrrE family metallo-endopeptidase [Clostridia bacterium]|nr:ImmA/IrrE family metallo-endopeptidase [Clostridia bacterium]